MEETGTKISGNHSFQAGIYSLTPSLYAYTFLFHFQLAVSDDFIVRERPVGRMGKKKNRKSNGCERASTQILLSLLLLPAKRNVFHAVTAV